MRDDDSGLDAELAEAGRRLRAAREHLVDVMVRAREAGLSYRDIGEHVGLSHETVRTMTRDRPDA